jgi:hypothetical protein
VAAAPRLEAGLHKIILGHSGDYERSLADPSPTVRRGLSPVLARAVVERAHGEKLRVVAHVTSAGDFRAALDAGVDQIAHLPPNNITSAADAQRFTLTQLDATRAARAGVVVGIVYVEGEGNPGGLQLVSPAGQLLEKFAGPSVGNYAYPHCLQDDRVLVVHRRAGTSAIAVVTPTQQTTLLEVLASNPVTLRFPVLVGSTHIVFERRDPTAGVRSHGSAARDFRASAGRVHDAVSFARCDPGHHR